MNGTERVTADMQSRVLRVARFLVAGGTAAAVNIGLLYVITDKFGVWYVASEIIAFIVAFIVSFSLQKFWTFADKSTHLLHRQVLVYLLITVTNLVINTGLLYLLTEEFGIHYLISQILASGLIAIESYFVYQHFVFETEL